MQLFSPPADLISGGQVFQVLTEAVHRQLELTELVDLEQEDHGGHGHGSGEGQEEDGHHDDHHLGSGL